jgi:hypothetical protein
MTYTGDCTMLECLILGDSIGHGISSVMPNCAHITEIGISTDLWYKKYHARPLLDMESYRYTVISLGSNDQDNSGAGMRLIREKVRSGQVIWVLPSDQVKAKQRAVVNSVAAEFGDTVLNITDRVGADKVHPPTVQAYEQIAKTIKDTVK